MKSRPTAESRFPLPARGTTRWRSIAIRYLPDRPVHQIRRPRRRPHLRARPDPLGQLDPRGQPDLPDLPERPERPEKRDRQERPDRTNPDRTARASSCVRAYRCAIAAGKYCRLPGPAVRSRDAIRDRLPSIGHRGPRTRAIHFASGFLHAFIRRCGTILVRAPDDRRGRARVLWQRAAPDFAAPVLRSGGSGRPDSGRPVRTLRNDLRVEDEICGWIEDVHKWS